MEAVKPKQNLFEYDNYREFLRDFYALAKAKDKKFSFRYFARKAGFKSQNFLKQVFEGQRNLSDESIAKFAKALNLNKSETQFFTSLVHFNQAATSVEKQAHAKDILKCRLYKKSHPLGESQFNFFSHWFYIPIRGLVGLTGFKEDAEWIAKHISPTISPTEAKNALNELLKLGLIERTPLGHLVQTSTNVSTADEVASSTLAQTHKDFMRIAAESIDRFPRDERDISSITLQITKEKANKIKEMIQNFRKTVVEEASQETAPNRIYQVNFQFFPLMKEIKESEK